MNEQPDKQYRELFRALAVSPEKEAALRERVTERLRNARCAGQPRPPVATRFPSFTRVACAAAILLALLGLHLLWFGDSTPGPQVASDMAISETCREAGALFFNELETLFGQRLESVAEAGGKVEMSIRPEMTAAMPDLPPLLSRTIVQRRRNDGRWINYLQADVIVRSERFAEVIPAAYPGARLHLWISPTPDGRMAVDTAFFLADGIKISAHLSDVIYEGQATEMTRIESEHESYRVFQIVKRLEEPLG